MKVFKQALLIATMLLSASAFTCSEDGKEGIVPPNDFKIYPNQRRNGGLSEEQYHAVINRVETVYAPVFANLGSKLLIQRFWADPKVNASAERKGKTSIINLFGGFARQEALTLDAFALVVCHEIGHHLGGAPKSKSIYGVSWSSYEGQADYFATLKCLRRVFLYDNNPFLLKRARVPDALVSACHSQWSDVNERAICVRSGLAALNLANIFAAHKELPPTTFETPDMTVVDITNDKYPVPQCRLDTYLQGAICEKSFNEDLSSTSEVTGTCHNSTGQRIGLRPRCWFMPSISLR